MRLLGTRQDRFKDVEVNDLARACTLTFGAVPFQAIVLVSNVMWTEPFYLTVPSEDNAVTRAAPPLFIRCERATNVTDRSVLVTPGGVSFEWAGDGRARIDAVGGLTPGVKYDLVFSAVGGVG